MIINWFGQGCFKIEGKEAIVITDPYSNKTGLRLPRLKADIVTVSHDQEGTEAAKNIKEEPFIIDQPGEYELKNVLVWGVPLVKNGQTKPENNIIFSLNIDGIKIAHLGRLNHDIADEKLESLGEVDILMIPVGGNYTLGTKAAAKLISQIEPRLVLPMHYKIPGLKIKVDSIKNFCQEMGAKEEYLDKLKISKKDLPHEETEVILLRS